MPFSAIYKSRTRTKFPPFGSALSKNKAPTGRRIPLGKNLMNTFNPVRAITLFLCAQISALHALFRPERKFENYGQTGPINKLESFPKSHDRKPREKLGKVCRYFIMEFIGVLGLLRFMRGRRETIDTQYYVLYFLCCTLLLRFQAFPSLENENVDYSFIKLYTNLLGAGKGC